MGRFAGLYFTERYRKTEKDYPDYPRIDRIGLQGDAMNVAVCEENEHIDTDMELFEKSLREDDEIIGERLHVLRELLQKIEKA